jgi:hypothetical protein
MKNPAEEIVTAWLQECMEYFTMNNIKVPKPKGGMGAEIDILATGKHGNIWVEVSVSTHPRCNYRKEIRFRSIVDDQLRDFQRSDKKKKVAEYFKDGYEMWLVYGKLPLPKEELARFPGEMRRHRIHPVSFADVFKDMRKLKHYRLDAARGYMNLFETFHQD